MGVHWVWGDGGGVVVVGGMGLGGGGLVVGWRGGGGEGGGVGLSGGIGGGGGGHGSMTARRFAEPHGLISLRTLVHDVRAPRLPSSKARLRRTDSGADDKISTFSLTPASLSIW